MIRSMTGFGKYTCELPDKKVDIEIKSLNSKQLDLNMRMPQIYRDREFDIRNLFAAEVQRGKVDLTITVESAVPDKIPQINEQIFEHYYKRLKSIAENLGINESTDFIRTILYLPETMKVEQNQVDEDEWRVVRHGILEALEAMKQFRIQEGAALYEDIMHRIDLIESLSQEVEKYEKSRIDRIRGRIRESLDELADRTIDQNRFEQELIYYLEKLDVTEEKVRLRNHIAYFRETIAEDDQVGKKLGFITQEIGREINTLGSKANDSDIQKLVIQMKDELEKIKEQLLNVL
ncbi:YicC/YloC family endoribonuclease [Xiashengella succiniciproducens]|jgi:uncharacterized protein (TIGR00255 family)|uniref:YicC family protein n=1 Tax=Xiashengella succiniciproducens TaxID=2949635 RepID=A0A9J6ZSI0_9BACT|nr:YicC/YloC family endoribonuclease [Alkaliflexus sp. Ai-910]URW80558.1 YicC family protein [Alkaliflexus sp. Ai-910]HHU01107.1 YicC family protein [Bacteroidales bacterium]